MGNAELPQFVGMARPDGDQREQSRQLGLCGRAFAAGGCCLHSEPLLRAWRCLGSDWSFGVGHPVNPGNLPALLSVLLSLEKRVEPG